MRRLAIFGMFVVIMIATTADAFFGRKEVEKIKEQFEYKGSSYIESIEPSSGAPCITVTLKGKNFKGIGSVKFGWKTARIIEQSDDKLVVEVPYGKGEETVEVTVGVFDTSNSVLFTYKNPIMDSISPSFGKVGTEVVIEGRHFGVKGPHPSFYVKFGKSLAGVNIESWDDKEIVVKAPSDYGTGKTDERIINWMKKIAIAGATGGMTIPDFVLNVIKDLATSGVKIPPGESKIEVDVKIVTPAGESNTKVFTYQFSDETLPTLPLPEWKEISVKDGLATALVMDKSGSMSGKKVEGAKEAAYIYVNTSLEQDDMVSLSAFSSNAESITEPISITEGGELLKKDIFSLSAGGSTNVGAGLAVAFSHLSSSSRKDKKAILMSDGRHNTGTYKPEVAKFQKKGWIINTVGFGRDADQDMLRWIANQTGGQFFSLSVANIGSGYHKLNVVAHNGSVYRSYNDFIQSEQKLAYNIPVQSDMKKVGFFTNWQGSTMNTTLISPSRTVINRSNINRWGRFVGGKTHSLYEIDNPQCGSWEVLVTGQGLPPKGEQINFHSYCYSDIFSNALGLQPEYSLNEKVQIGLKLAEVVNGRLLPLRGVQVTAEVKKPSISLQKVASDIDRGLDAKTISQIFREVSDRTKKITLFDDGLHQDVEPGDGIYANTYTGVTINGPYLVNINCQGNASQGISIDRTLQESFQVGRIEQNKFTISDFLGVIEQGSRGEQMPVFITETVPRRLKKQQTEKIVESLFNRFSKKR